MAQYGQPNQVYQGNNNFMNNSNQNQMSNFQNTYQNSGGMGPRQTPMGPQSWSWDWLKDMFMGRPEMLQQFQQFEPDQQQGLQQLLQRGLGGIDQFDFAPIEQQARTNFAQNTMPSIAERFTQLGGGNSLGSGARERMMAGAQSGLEENLAAMKSNYNLQREPMMQNYLKMGMMPRFDSRVQERQQGLFETMGGPLMKQGVEAGGQAAISKFLPWLMAL
jgi:hypothetical protein